MTLPSAPNVLVDVYRGLNVNSPFPPDGTRAALYQVPGVLKHHVKNGRFGYQATNLHWTHLLLVDISTDVRDAYNSLLNGESVAQADTVLIPSCLMPGGCCAFTAVLCQQRRRPSSHLRVYLDRWQPRLTPCTQPPNGQVVSDSCGLCAQEAQTWILNNVQGIRDGACDEGHTVNGTWVLKYRGPLNPCQWDTDEQLPLPQHFQCGTGPVWRLTFNFWNTDFWDLRSGGISSTGWQLHKSLFSCNGDNTLTLWTSGPEYSNLPSTLTISPG